MIQSPRLRPLRRALRRFHTLHCDSVQVVLASLHLAFASAFFLRPNLFELYPVWQAFSVYASAPVWGLGAVGVALGMLLSRYGSVTSVAFSFASFFYFALVALLISGVTGYNTGTGVYATLTALSFFVGVTNLQAWTDRQRWPRVLMALLRRAVCRVRRWKAERRG